MEELDFLSEGENKGLNWVNFSNRVIPFLTDVNTKKLVKQYFKGFENSKVLKNQRVESQFG